MPHFDLRNIKIAKYTNTSGTVSYSNKTSIGDAITADLQLKFAEGRLYAEGTLAEYMRKATGGTISIGEKYIPDAAQQLMFGMRSKTRTVGTGTTTTVSGLQYGANDVPQAVGVAFYAPDMIDGVEKYTCVFIPRVIFGPPSMSLSTMGENIAFSTPTCAGEFMPDHSTNKELIETATASTKTDAAAWVDLVLGGT